MSNETVKLRALFVGLGSIGVRHLRNLRALCAGRGYELEVSALRSSARELPEDICAMVDVQVRELEPDACYDLAFITNPTQLHAMMVGLLKGHVGAFFIEKPIFEATGYELAALGLDEGQKAYVAAPLRWSGLYLALKERVKELPVYSARAICSSYLPGWRPDTDYRSVYSARRELGGGVTLDLIHEWDYLYDLLGEPCACHNLRGRYSKLEIDSDDLSVYIAEYPDFLCELHLDYFGRGYRRELELFSEAGSLLADFGTGLLKMPGGSVEDLGEDANRKYEREMAYFVDYALGEGGESQNSPRKALKVLKLALGEDYKDGKGEETSAE